jgi:hypothetical protein
VFTAFEVWRAKTNLDGAKTLVATVANKDALTTAGRARITGQIGRAGAKVSTAQSALGSPPLRVLGHLPVTGRNITAAREIAADARAALEAGQQAIGEVDGLANLKVTGGAGSEEVLSRLDGVLSRLDAAVRSGVHPRRPGLLGPVARARTSYNALASRTAGRLREATEALGAARGFMGTTQPRRYFLAAGNNAEMRDGGMVLSFAVVTFDKGRMTVDRLGRIGELALTHPSSAPVPAGTKAIYGPLDPAGHWQSVNATADTAFSGQAMVTMYKQATGQSIDGVLFVDVPALAGLLKVVGPLTVDGVSTPLTDANVARILMYEPYKALGRTDDPARVEQQAKVASALARRVTTESVDLVSVGGVLGDAASGRHVWLYSTRPDEQKVFERSGLAGGPGTSRPDRTLHLSVQNGTATKLDYFVKPSVKITAHITSQGSAVVTTDVTIHNEAPPGPPGVQLGNPSYEQTRVGQYVARTYFYGPSVGEQQDSVEEAGLRLNQAPIAVDPGAEQNLRFQTVIPHAVRDGYFDLRLVPQARLFPMPLTLVLDAPGWKVTGARRVTTTWSTTITPRWRLLK